MRLKCLLLAGLAYLSTTQLVGQVILHSNVEAPKRFSIVLNAGSGLSGTAGSLSDQMNHVGLGDADPSRCLYTNCRPPDSPEKEGLIWTIAVDARYLVAQSVAVGITAEQTYLGGAKGYRDADRTHLDSEWSALNGAIKTYWFPIGVLYIGAGPGWYRMESKSGGHTVAKIGLSGEAGLQFPEKGRGFMWLSVRGHLIPEEEVEHFIPGASPESGVLPSSVVLTPDWSHVTVSLGFGVRLF